MSKTFNLEIITPYRVFFKGKAESIIIDSVDGEMGILADHEPIVTPIAIGSAKVQAEGKWKTAALSDGFLEMEDNNVTVLIGAAEWPEEIDVSRAERALKRAKERLEDRSMPWETKRAELAQSRAISRLKIAKLSSKREN
jgi:F-type H+-transporting ATPase subunit epsilon